MTYLITFSGYGTRLHGDPAGSVDPNHNIANTPFLPVDPGRRVLEEINMRGLPFVMNEDQRECALTAMRAACALKDWTLLAAHVRSTHVHTVVAVEIEPERVLNGLKTAISRTLNRSGGVSETRRWSRHGSTKYLWTTREIENAIRYVTEKQGPPMSVYARGWER